MGSQRVWQDLATKTTKFFWKVFVEKTIFLSLNYPDTSGLCPSIRMLYLTVFSTFALEYWNEAILSLPILLVLFKNYLGNCICLTFYINCRVLISTWRSAAAAAAKSLQSCLTLCNPIDSSPLAPLSLGFSRQEYWSGLPFPSPILESEKWKWSRS